jgi:hypothetical protein
VHERYAVSFFLNPKFVLLDLATKAFKGLKECLHLSAKV